MQTAGIRRPYRLAFGATASPAAGRGRRYGGSPQKILQRKEIDYGLSGKFDLWLRRAGEDGDLTAELSAVKDDPARFPTAFTGIWPLVPEGSGV